MRQLAASLQTAQAVRAPRFRVTCTVENRGTGPDVPAVEWSELVSNSGQSTFKVNCTVGLANGSMLRFVRTSPTNIEQETIGDPTVAGEWSSPDATATILTHDVSGLNALRIGSTIRLWYIHAGNGNVLYIESTDNGGTWGSPVTVYSGGDASHDLVVSYIDNDTISNGPWFFGFSVFSGGTYTPRFGYHNGSAWVTFAYSADWRAAGIDAYGTEEDEARCLVFRPQNEGPSRLRQVDLLSGSFSDAIDIDQTQAGGFGLSLSWFRFCQLVTTEAMLGVCGEHAKGSGAYVGYCNLFHNVDQLIDEPIIFPDIATVTSSAFFHIAEDSNGNLYLAGDTAVYIGQPQTATGQTLEPLRYIYDDGTLTIEFDAEKYSTAFPTVLVGQLLRVTRTISWDGDSGSEDLLFYIVRMETVLDYQSRRKAEPGFKVVMVCYDPVGFLGIARCRRPMIANGGSADGVAEVVRKIVARFGLKLYNDTTSLESASVLPMTLQPSESLLGALYRASAQSNFYLVPRNDGEWWVSMILPDESNGGDYDDTAHTYGDTDEQPIIKVMEVSEYRRLAFAYILGTHSTDPEDGASVGMADGPTVPNTRPLSYSLTNTRYNTQDRVSDAATAEATRQQKLNVDAVMTTWPNLALEKYDIVQVTESRLGWSAKEFRVRRIVERWEKGVLTQDVYLGVEA